MAVTEERHAADDSPRDTNADRASTAGGDESGERPNARGRRSRGEPADPATGGTAVADPTPKSAGLVTSVKRTLAWVLKRPLVRGLLRYGQQAGTILASGIAYQGIFALFAGIWVGFTIFGLIVGHNEHLQDLLIDQVNKLVPNLIGAKGAISSSALTNISTTLTVTGIIALAGLFYTAISTLTSVRTAIRRMIGVLEEHANLVQVLVRDFVVAVLFAFALVLSAILSTAGTTAIGTLLRILGLPSESLVAIVIGRIVTLALMVGLNMLIAALMYRGLSGLRIPVPILRKGALLVGFALSVIQVLGSTLIGGASRNPLLATFATFIGIMIWLNLLAQIALIGASYIAVLLDDADVDPRPLTARQLEQERVVRRLEARIVLAEAELGELRAERKNARWWRRSRAERRIGGVLAQLDAQRAELATARKPLPREAAPRQGSAAADVSDSADVTTPTSARR